MYDLTSDDSAQGGRPVSYPAKRVCRSGERESGTVNRFLSVLLMLGVSAVPACTSARMPGQLSIRADRPYVDIVFDLVGPRVPVLPGESNEGAWLRLRNNTAFPLRLSQLTPTGSVVNNGLLLPYEIVYSPGQVVSLFVPPAASIGGYRSSSDLSGAFLLIDPGGEVAFSVPVEHLFADCALEVRATIEIPVSFQSTDSGLHSPSPPSQPVTSVRFTPRDAGLPAELSSRVMSQRCEPRFRRLLDGLPE